MFRAHSPKVKTSCKPNVKKGHIKNKIGFNDIQSIIELIVYNNLFSLNNSLTQQRRNGFDLI